MEWISVDERLPESDERVLMWWLYALYPMAGYYDHGLEYWVDVNFAKCVNITHWAVINAPEPTP